MTEPAKPEKPWRDEVLAIADRYHRYGRETEKRALGTIDTDSRDELWTQSGCYRQMCADLHALVNKVDPRPGAAWTGPPW